MPKPSKRPAAPAAPSQRPRNRIERISAPALLRLHGLPRWAFPLVTAALMLGGLLTTSAALSVVLLSALALLLMWLIALSWPLLAPVARVMRIAVIGALVLVIVNRAQGRM